MSSRKRSFASVSDVRQTHLFVSVEKGPPQRRGPKGHFKGSRKVFLEGQLPMYNARKKGNRQSFWHQLSLGAKLHLSRGYMVIKLWFFKHFAQHETTGYMLSYFTKKIPLWSECTQGLHCDYIWKKHTTLITIYPAIKLWLHLKRKQHKNWWVLCERKPWFLSQFCLQCIQPESEPLIESSFTKCPAM